MWHTKHGYAYFSYNGYLYHLDPNNKHRAQRWGYGDLFNEDIHYWFGFLLLF